MTLNANISQKFRDAFEQKCFILIIEAYRTSLREKIIQLDWNENDISSEIHKHIKANALRCKWNISTNVESYIPDDTIKKVKGFADKFPRIDLKMATFYGINEYEYFFEAKNLKQNNSALKRRYIETGINSFVSKKYKNGCLVAYLLEGEIEKTINGINLLLEKKDKRYSEILKHKPNKLFDFYYESNHPEIGMLKHLIFDFTII